MGLRRLLLATLLVFVDLLAPSPVDRMGRRHGEAQVCVILEGSPPVCNFHD